MTRICPQPDVWNNAYKRLLEVAAARPDMREVPVPLLLAGWAWSNDVEKMARWEMTVQWAKEAGCEEIVTTIADKDFHFVHVPTDYEVGPSGGPMYRSWDLERKERPQDTVLTAALANLCAEWPAIAVTFAEYTRPICFSGEKARRLVVAVLTDAKPPWGAWHERSYAEEERRTFTAFRRAVNEAIAPHEVDHIEFVKQSP